MYNKGSPLIFASNSYLSKSQYNKIWMQDITAQVYCRYVLLLHLSIINLSLPFIFRVGYTHNPVAHG